MGAARGTWTSRASRRSALKVVSITRPASNTIHLQCLGVPNAINRVQSSTTPSAAGFSTVASIMADAAGAFQFNDSSAGHEEVLPPRLPLMRFVP